MCISKVAATGAIACEMQNNTYRQYGIASIYTLSNTKLSQIGEIGMYLHKW